MPWREDISVNSSARSSSGDSGVLGVNYADFATLRAELNVTAVSGTGPTLDAVIEDTLDGVNFNTIGTFSQKTGIGRQVINVYPKDNPGAGFDYPFANRLRVRWTIGGTSPSFTFSVAISAKG